MEKTKEFWQLVMQKKYPYDIRKGKLFPSMQTYKALNAQIVGAMMDCDVIKNRSTSHVYKTYYLPLTSQNFIKKPWNQIQFSLFVVNNFPICIENVKKNGIKYRVFREYSE